MNPYDTHEVSNQVAPFADINLFDCDPALREALLREGGAAEVDALHALGRQLGRAETLEWARLANRNGPVLVNFDGNGRRIDEVEFHPAWHSLMALLIGHGAHASPWDSAASGAQAGRALAAEDTLARVRPALAADRAKAWRAAGHGHDGKAGWFRRAQQHHHGHRAGAGRGGAPVRRRRRGRPPHRRP